jgi:hypothetical protein
MFDNVLQILLQASRWRVKTANTILQIPWKKVKSYANTPTWSKRYIMFGRGICEKIPVLRLNFTRHSAREIVRLETGIFRKYPSQTWYICILVFYPEPEAILWREQSLLLTHTLTRPWEIKIYKTVGLYVQIK